MELLILILFPIAGALIEALTSKSPNNKGFGAFVNSIFSFAAAIYILVKFVPDASTQFVVDLNWIPAIGAHFKLGVDGISLPLILLTNTLVPLIILSTFKHTYEKPNAFYALILFMQAGLLVVFLALDGFLFYVGWEAALIPIYFICAIWGGEDRIKVNLKFFIYTFSGSLLMLLALIFLYLQTPAKTYDLQAFYNLSLDAETQGWLFWAFFLAFAIKMPIFPFHTWQPDTYTTAPTAGTMLLSGIMLKMGIYGVIRWLIPVVPLGYQQWGKTAMILSIIGIVYAAVIAFRQKEMKRLVAYSSISHVGLIAAGVFAFNLQGLQGALFQMLSHGINIVGMFFIIDIIIRETKTSKIESLGGIAKVAPGFAIAFLIIVLGTVALPLTNGFIGEFLLLSGVYQYQVWFAAIAGLTIIFGAVYLLRMYKNVMQGETNSVTVAFKDISGSEKVMLFIVCALIIIMGVYPQYLLHLSEAAVNNLVTELTNKISLVK